MLHLQLFARPFVEYLKSNVSEYIDRYRSEASWAGVIPYPAERMITTRIQADIDVPLVAATEGVIVADTTNAIAIHRALNGLTPAQATDERLWAYLCHIPFWPYMRARWPVERFASDSSKARRFLLERYFVPQAQGRSLMRNGLSRLWWAAHLTVDYERENAYELTGVLLAKLDITKNLLERSLGRSPVILRAFLDFVQQNADELLAPGSASRLAIRRLSRYLNLVGGTCVLDTLTTTQILDLLSRELERINSDTAPLLVAE